MDSGLGSIMERVLMTGVDIDWRMCRGNYLLVMCVWL